MSAPNPSYKPSEGKREEFRKYLEKNGVMDALTRVLVNLYEETDKPEDALEYIRDKLAAIAGLETNKQLLLKLTDAEERIKELEAQVQTESKSAEGEPPSANPEGSIGELPAEPAPPEDVQVKSEENVVPKEEPVPEEPVDAEQ